jgi:hypothetical protein
MQGVSEPALRYYTLFKDDNVTVAFTHVNQSRDCTFFDFPSTEFSALGKVPLFSIQQSTNLQLPEEKSLVSQVLHLLRDLVYFSQYLCIKDKMVTVNNGIRIHGVCNGIVE